MSTFCPVVDATLSHLRQESDRLSIIATDAGAEVRKLSKRLAAAVELRLQGRPTESLDQLMALQDHASKRWTAALRELHQHLDKTDRHVALLRKRGQL